MRIALGILAFLCFLTGCATTSEPAALEPYQLVDSRAATALGISDRVRIIVYDEPQLSGEFTVNEFGYISFPLLGDLQAAGLTIDELKSDINTRLSDGFLKEPRVAAEVSQYRPYYILGEVNQPGEYAYNTNLSVLKAVAVAQGFTYRANKTTVYIKRSDSDQEVRVKLTQTLKVYPGDIIRIGERFF